MDFIIQLTHDNDAANQVADDLNQNSGGCPPTVCKHYNKELTNNLSIRAGNHTS